MLLRVYIIDVSGHVYKRVLWQDVS